MSNVDSLMALTVKFINLTNFSPMNDFRVKARMLFLDRSKICKDGNPLKAPFVSVDMHRPCIDIFVRIERPRKLPYLRACVGFSYIWRLSKQVNPKNVFVSSTDIKFLEMSSSFNVAK